MATVRKAIITAAGRGTRQYPASHTVQKELFPLVDTDGYAKPTLQIIVEEVLASGIDEVCIVANRDNLEAIRTHFRGLTDAQKTGQFRGKDWAFPLSDALADMEQKITFVVQEMQEGFGHAVYQARDWAGSDPFALLLGDHVYLSALPELCTRQVLQTYATYGCPVSSVARTSAAHLPRYGIVAGKHIGETVPAVYDIQAMAEKPSLEYAQAHLTTPGLPEGAYLCFFGIHVFPPALFDCLHYLIAHNIRQKNEIQLTSAQALLFEQGRYVACEVAGERFDMGIPEGLIETQIALALRSPFAAQARAMLGT